MKDLSDMDGYLFTKRIVFSRSKINENPINLALKTLCSCYYGRVFLLVVGVTSLLGLENSSTFYR